MVAQAALVAYWTADGVFTDASGNGHHAQIAAGTDFAAGVHGQAFDFSHGSEDVLTVAHSPQFNFGTGDFSVTFWVNFDDITNNQNGIIDKDSFSDPSTSSYRGWLFNIATAFNGAGLEVRDIPGQQANARWSGYTVGTWYNMTGVRESNVLKLYINGNLIVTESEPGGINVSNTADLVIGGLRRSGEGGQFMDGQLDDIAIFSHALSPADASFIASNGVGAFVVPEPTAALLLSLGLIPLAVRKR